LAAANLDSDLSANMPTTILICGSPADGFQIVGLFADSGDAESYAEDHSLIDWWVAELTSPEAFAESQRPRRLQAARCKPVEMSAEGEPLIAETRKMR
jgi:hypothetical protein